ncbi:MAG: ABC transporter ATP-binding protein [Candidatus Woesearchaeota archaeon]|jgi:branched-chain amino acid transport system ATP-binding protein|nr:ABC transporter ATP-binding protein [Candidatus Woesearchaeota archaeon]MDP7323559.1 ABC transporter ATP-binding protein [Candidatus Woesearchaeota archaeon]MDP7457682.1 ABC transporter ATP-binding protein [Candidatus Woesearchaeota archaeon]|tara:strand:+ start:163 stop:870 length:708 start_codon:yes stop_codon:yes gene_type:complete
MLEIEKLHAGYDELEVLKGINLKVDPGEIVALIGPNGAGKSTVIKSIFNIATVTGGRIVFKEKDITGLKTHELMELGVSYVNQGRINFGNLTVKENLEIGAPLITDQEVMDKNLAMVYEKFPILKERADKLAYGLSGGQQQMLALGRALMQNPALLLLDEPSLGLSPKLQKEVFATISRLRDDGIAMLIVEQNAKKAIEIADRTYLLEDGKIALTGDKKILKDKKIKDVYLGGRY